MDAAAKINLKDVTLVAVTSVQIDETQVALQQCMAGIDFGAVLLVCSQKPSQPDPRISLVRIPPISHLEYSGIILKQLYTVIETSHCLIVQADGFVVAPSRWEPGFLDYDYIGAPWGETVGVMAPDVPMWTLALDRNRVGNGGFSLRSRKFLEATASFPIHAGTFPVSSEDLVACHYLYDDMRAKGIRYAPLEVAARFAVENPDAVAGASLETVFGFHGVHLLEHAVTLLGDSRICSCGSGQPLANCHGRLWARP